VTGTPTFDYAGARAQARHGQLLPEAQWERLARVPDFALYAQTARETALRPWVATLDAATRPHVLEAALRAQFRAHVRAVAAWVPRAWRPALRWIETLPDLPVASHLLAGEPAYEWMGADPALARVAVRNLTAWLAQWRKFWPDDAAARAPLERLVRDVRRVAQDAAREDAATARARLEPVLRRAFRRHTRAPAGLVAYLALSWLQLARLRGALLRRRFTVAPEVATP